MAGGAVVDEFSGQAGEICDLLAAPRRTLLLGLGDQADAAALRAAGARAACHLAAVKHIALDALGLSPELAAAFVEGACLRNWHDHSRKTAADPERPRLQKLDLLVDAPDAMQPVWCATSAMIRGTLFARELVSEPSNTLTPAGFVERLAPLRQAGVKLQVLHQAALRRKGFGALLAVGAGSRHKPCLAALHWPGTIDAPPVAFVGKGITFDTGGICIKPADRMWEMRGDMAGAAACAGAVLSLALRRSPAPVIAVLPLAENATGASSYRPGDVLQSYSGQTIEVVDTDAEGRLVLADALAYVVARHKPQAIVDLATLTGSIVTALGHHMAGLFDNDAALAAFVAAAGAAVSEPLWRMPIGDSHREDIKSDIADLRHCLAGRLLPDACHAAAFLREFVGETPWVHLDIAGVEAKEEADELHAQGPTGFGVRLLDRLVAMHFEEAER
jgi:leucyl aminopeptidase